MQAKSEHFSEFSERTNTLADHLGLSLRELASKIGISQAMLFAYRSGKNPISKKAWRALEAAERAAGIPTPDQQVAAVQETAGKYAGSEDHFNRLVVALSSKLEELDEKINRLDELERRLEEFIEKQNQP